MKNKFHYACQNPDCNVVMHIEAFRMPEDTLQGHLKNAHLKLATNYPAHHCAWCRATIENFLKNTLRALKKNYEKLPLKPEDDHEPPTAD